MVTPSGSRTGKTVSATTTIVRVGSKGVAEFRVTIKKSGRYSLKGSVDGVRGSTRTQSVKVRPAPFHHHSRWWWR
jgi:hypothetical protein